MMKRALTCASVILAFSLLPHCSGLVTTKIGDIDKDPRRYADREVIVSGGVTQIFSLVVIKYFTLKDNTGEITIVTQRPLPREGERLTVKGTVREAFSIGTQTFLVIVEEPEKGPSA